MQKEFQKERHFMMGKSLPKLADQHGKYNDSYNKRISISTCLERMSPKKKYQRQRLQMDFRNEVLNTENLVEQHLFLTSQLSQTCQNFNTFNQRTSTEFDTHEDLFPVQKNDKILSQFQLLQKKKKLKIIKSEIDLKKNKLFDQIQNKKLQKRQEQLLHKKFTQNSKQMLKEKFSRQKLSSQLVSIFNIEDHKSTDQRISIGFILENNQKQNSKIWEIDEVESLKKSEVQNLQESSKELNFQNENKIKSFLRYFKKSDPERRPHTQANQSSQQSKSKKDTTSTKNKTISCSDQQPYTPLFNKSQSVDPIFYDKDKMIQKGLFRMIQQKVKKINDQNNNAILNAKMRIRFNHKKIVNLGKTQKLSSFGINAYDNNQMYQN